MNTPWGEMQTREVLAEGIVQVGTASHGGIKLDGERLKQMPSEERTRDSWYEEDCEAAFVLRNFMGLGVIEANDSERNAIERSCARYGSFDAVRMER